MATKDEISSVDDLQYDWPPNVLAYESVRLLGGLSITDLMAGALPGAFLLAVNLWVGLAAIAVGLVLCIRFEGLGGRRLLGYAFAWLRFRFTRRPVALPAILPTAGDNTLRILDGEGNVVAEIVGGEP